MNSRDWDNMASNRRQDLERAAQRHRIADEVSEDHPLRYRVGEWMVKTGKRLLEDEQEMGVGMARSHKHVTG